jgi:hypothetical protein
MDSIFQAWPFRPNQIATVIIGSVCFAFFLGLSVHSWRQGTKGRGYVPGLVLITIASLNMLVRGLFFPMSSPNPAGISGLFRMANGFVALAGGIMFERERRRQRTQPP